VQRRGTFLFQRRIVLIPKIQKSQFLVGGLLNDCCATLFSHSSTQHFPQLSIMANAHGYPIVTPSPTIPIPSSFLLEDHCNRNILQCFLFNNTISGNFTLIYLVEFDLPNLIVAIKIIELGFNINLISPLDEDTLSSLVDIYFDKEGREPHSTAITFALLYNLPVYNKN